MKIELIKILNLGQLKADEEEKKTSVSSPSGYFLRPETIQFIKTTDKIKGIKGVKFGIEFFIKGFTDDKDDVTFHTRISHPTMTNPLTNKVIQNVTETKTDWLNEINFDYFSFEFDWELVTGKWIFEIIEDDWILLTKKFEVA
jgi:hypothetical protein